MLNIFEFSSLFIIAIDESVFVYWICSTIFINTLSLFLLIFLFVYYLLILLYLQIMSWVFVARDFQEPKSFIFPFFSHWRILLIFPSKRIRWIPRIFLFECNFDLPIRISVRLWYLFILLIIYIFYLAIQILTEFYNCSYFIKNEKLLVCTKEEFHENIICERNFDNNVFNNNSLTIGSNHGISVWPDVCRT